MPRYNQTQRPQLRQVQAQGPSLDFAVCLLRRNLVRYSGECGEYTALGVWGTTIVIPRHAYSAEFTIDGKPTKAKSAYELITPAGTTRELICIELDRNEKFRDIRSYFPEHSQQTYEDCTLVINTNTYPNMFIPVGQATPANDIMLDKTQVADTMYYNYPTRTGQCGGVVCKTGLIVGMHIGGNGAQGFAATLKRNMFPADVMPQGEIVARGKSKKNIHISEKTKLQPSVFHHAFDGVKEPAVLTRKDPRCEVNFDEALLSKYKGNSPVKYAEDEEMQVAVQHYAAQLSTLDINPDPISMEQAIYGMEGLEALDLATSAGYPYVTMGIKKRDIITPDHDGSLKRMGELMDKYGIDLPFVTYIKDELRKPDKIKAGKSRVIEASSLNDSVAMRMHFGNLYATFHKNPGVVTGCAVGCDPEVFWSKIPCMMESELLAFDYTNYDASLSPCWFEALRHCLHILGFTKAGPFVQYMCNSYHVMRGEWYAVRGGMPSGTSGTSIFNSMINNIIIRTLVLKTYKNIDLDRLKIIAYGDDVIASYPFELDAEMLAKAGAQYGLTMTPADKGEKFEKVTWDNVTFLKRGFRADPRYPFLVHPTMPMSEIHESIRWTKDPTKTQEHVLSLCQLAWHNGQTVYENFCQQIRTVNLARVLYLPNYHVLQKQWYDKF